MSDAWLKLMSNVHRHPKVIGLPSHAARWAFIVTLAEGKAVRGRWESEKHYRECCRSVAVHLPALVTAGLVERDGDALIVHDWAEYQSDPVKRSDPTAAERMRRKRARDKASREGSGDGVTHRNVTDVLARETETETESETETETETPRPPDQADAIEAYYRLTVSFPAGRVLAWLEDLVRDFGDARVVMALADEWSLDEDRRTFLSRVQDRLRRVDHQAAKRREAAAAAAAEAERQRIEAMPEEQRAANLKRLGDMMREAGLAGGRD